MITAFHATALPHYIRCVKIEMRNSVELLNTLPQQGNSGLNFLSQQSINQLPLLAKMLLGGITVEPAL